MINSRGFVSALWDSFARTRSVRISLAVAILFITGIARSAEQSPDALRLELTSPFSGTPRSLDGSTSGEFLVTTTSSGTLTLWSRYSQTVWTREVIHPPPRDEYATGGYYGAISPDGDYVALAVPPLSDGRGSYRPNTARIYVIDRASRQLITSFSAGIPTRITALRFSPDGTRLGAMLAHGCGVRVWTRRQWTDAERGQQPDFADDDGYGGAEGMSGCCPGTDMSACESLPNGADVLFTGISDGSGPWMITMAKTGLRAYILAQGRPQRVGSDLLTSDQMHLDQPTRMALSPDKTMLAVGDHNRPQVAILTRDGMRFRWSTFPNWNTNLSPDSLFNVNGKREEGAGGLFITDPVWAQSGGNLILYAFGYLPSDAFSRATPGSKANRIAVFDPRSSDVRFVTLGDDTDTSLRAFQSAKSPSSILFISPNALSSIDVDASTQQVIAGRAALDLRGNDSDWTLKLNTQNRLLYISSSAGDRGAVALEFDTSEMRIIDRVKPFPSLDGLRSDIKVRDAAHGYYDADHRADEWRFHSPVGKVVPMFFGKPLATQLDPTETSYSGALLADRNIVVWGTDRALRIIGGDAKVKCTRPIGSPAFRMNVTPDKRLVVVGHGDGAVRWYRLGDTTDPCLSLVASLYPTRNEDGSWGFLAWLPNGKFMTAGGAALKDLACYPVGGPDSLGRCTPFQDTKGYFSPDEVKRALAEAISTEPTQNLAEVVTAKAEERPGGIHLVPAKYDPDSPKLSVTVSVTGLGAGPRYLTMSSSGTDVPFAVDDTSYSRDHPYRIDQRPTSDVIVDLPPNVQHYDDHFTICAEVSSSPGAVMDGGSRLRLTQPCKELIWTGGNGPDTKNMLWALVIGFSESPRDGAPQLQFAHEDAINLARFLQRDYKGELPGKSSFNDVDVTLVATAPNLDWTALNHDPRIETIRNGLTPGKFHFSKIDDGHYVDYVKNTLDDFLNKILQQPVKANINNKILIYFAGHGFTNYIQDRNGPYLKLGLVTPDYDAKTKSGVIWLEQDLANHLRTSDLVSMIIIDACSARNDAGMDNYGTSQKVQLNLFSRPPIDDQSQLQLFLGTERGSVSYEEQGYSVDDFFQDSLLWPQNLRAKGSGVFSLGLLASLLCREGAAGDRFTFASSEDFMSVHFFSQTNKTWDQQIRPQLEQVMHGEFVKPDPEAFGYPGGRLESPILRLGAAAVPKCGF
jgi:WD40 repeat protein